MAEERLKIDKTLEQLNILRDVHTALKELTFMLKWDYKINVICRRRRYKSLIDRADNINSIIESTEQALETINNQDGNGINETVQLIDRLFKENNFPREASDLTKGVMSDIRTIDNGFDLWFIKEDHHCSFVAETLVDGIKKYSVLKPVKEKKLVFFPALQEMSEDELPKPAIHFLYSELLSFNMYPYLELRDKFNNSLGHISFQLFRSSMYYHNFMSMCTGQDGHSYKGTMFFSKGGVHNKYIVGGDYEFNNGSGGKSVCNIIPEVPDPNNLSVHHGIVCGVESRFSASRGSQFKIFYNYSSYKQIAKQFMGYVNSPYQVVDKIASMDAGSVFVSDCGISCLSYFTPVYPNEFYAAWTND